MNTFEKHLLFRLKKAIAARNHKNQSTRIYARYEIERLIKSIRNERNGTNDALAKTYQKRALAFAKGNFAALR